MTDEILVKVENLSKKFCRNLKRSLWYGVQDIGSEMLGRKYEHQLRKDEFWSVKDISFKLRRGECLALIGPNGAGKSTLLKMLNGLIKPDQGRIELRGRIGALIELSSGFNPILTGRENIYSRGAILGFTTAEIDKKLDAIIDFSELEEFIDTPVVNYSSGMKVRLGFAVAAQMEPDVLLLDEVLAVGDVGFRAKCFNTIYKMIKNSAVILVSHSMPQISRVCSDIVVMNHGVCEYQGKNIAKGIDLFYNNFKAIKDGLIMDNGKVDVQKIVVEAEGKTDVEVINYSQELLIHLSLKIDSSITHPTITFVLINQELQEIAMCCSKYNDFDILNQEEDIKLEVSLGKVNLNPGIYSIGMTIHAENETSSLLSLGEVIYKNISIKTIKIKGNFSTWVPVQIIGDWERK